MSDYQFNVMGSMRSMDNFLRGFSISFMLAALVMGAVGVVLGRERAGLLKRVALVNTIWLATMTAVSFHYFFRNAHFISGNRVADFYAGLAEPSAIG